LILSGSNLWGFWNEKLEIIFSNFRRAKFIDLYGTGLTNEQIQFIQNLLPNVCKIYY